MENVFLFIVMLQENCNILKRHLRAILYLILLAGTSAHALTPPREGELEKYEKDGSLAARRSFAERLGTNQFDPALLRQYIDRETKNNPSHVHDKTYAPPPAWQGGLPSKGSPKILVLLVDFPDYPASASDTSSDVSSKFFGNGDASKYPYESLRNFYQRSSYGNLNISGNVLGWYRAKNNRSHYEQNYQYIYNGESYGYGQEELIKEALNYFNAQGHDFTQYDNQGSGKIDALFIKWTGPDNGWSNFWWAYQSNWWYNSSYTIDGKKIGKYVWSWVKNSSWGDTIYNPRVDIHETGHLLGLPDYYDYDKNTGPAGGLGGLDMMDGNWGDHNAFSKSVLDWTSPDLITSGARTLSLSPAASSPSAVRLMPNATSSLFDEYFLIEYRKRGTGNDSSDYPNDGLLVWHVNAKLNSSGTNYANDNSYSTNKLLRLVQADGLEQIEKTNLPSGGRADAGDFFVAPKSFGASTTPNSNAYSGAKTNVGFDTLGAAGSTLTARFGIDLGNVSSYALTVSVTGSGGVSSTPSGIKCPSDCTETYGSGTVINLVATPSAGYKFTGWGGACSGTGSCSVTMSAAKSVQATFGADSNAKTLTINKSGTGTGTVTANGIVCASSSSACTQPFSQGTTITLQASPSVNSTFVGWSGSICTGTGTCSFNLTANTTVTASFNLQPGSSTCQARAFSSGEERVLGAYIAYYGRPADTGGLSYWTGRLSAAGGNIWTIIDPFGQSTEYQQRFGYLSTYDLVNNLYRQMYGRNADASGLSYYTNKVETGQSTLASIAITILDGTAGSDITVLENRKKVARHFVTKMEAKGASAPVLSDSSLANLMATVSADTASANTACQTLTGWIN